MCKRPVDVDATFGEGFDFGDERGGIDDYASADDGVLLGAQNAARDELENVTVFADDDGVTGVVAAGDAHDVVERACEIVDNFAFAFVAPLRADHDDRFHSEHLPCADVDSGIANERSPPDRSLQRKIRATHQFEIVRWEVGGTQGGWGERQIGGRWG